MEVEERRSWEDRGEERPGRGGSEAPLLCVLLPSFLHFHLSRSTSSPPLPLRCSLIIAAVQNRRICQRCVKRSAPRPSDGLPSTGGWIERGTKDPQKTPHERPGPQQNVFNSPPIDGRCMYGMCAQGHCIKVQLPRLSLPMFIE